MSDRRSGRVREYAPPGAYGASIAFRTSRQEWCDNYWLSPSGRRPPIPGYPPNHEALRPYRIRARHRRPPRRFRHRVRATGAGAAPAAPAAAPAAAPQLPADPWPRVVDLTNGAGAGLPAAGQQVGRQPDRLPRGARDQGHRRQGRDLRRDLRHRAHAGRQGRAHRRLREHEDQQDRFPDAAEPRRGLRARAAEGIRARRSARSRSTGCSPRSPLAGVKPPTVAGAEQSAAGARQLLAGHPGADRRRAGDEARAERLAGSSASSTRAR